MLGLADRTDRIERICEVRDIADHAEAGDDPEVGVRRLVPRGRSPMRPPLFLLGDAGEVDPAWLFGQIETPEVACYSLRDAVIAPTGIAIRGDTAFSSPAFLHPAHHVVAVVDRLNAAALRPRHVRGPVAVIDGPGHETWGHWLTDFLPRLAVLDAAGWDIGALRFVVPGDLSRFATGLLGACGIGEDRLIRYRHWREVLTTDLLLMPTGPRLGDRMSPFFAEATRFWQRRVLARLAVPRSRWPELLYVSRAGAAAARVMLDREAIEAQAKRRGLTVVRPESLELAEQMALFREARVVVGEYGSALHNSVFSAAGAVVCGLRGTSRHPGFYQSGIATALDQQAGYVFGSTAGQEVAQRFTIGAGAFDRAMDVLDCV